MLRGDEVPYKKDLSPYGLAHIVEDKVSYVSFQSYAAHYRPKKNVAPGATVVASALGESANFALVEKMQTRGRSQTVFCYLKSGNMTHIVKMENVIPVPAIGEFVRQLSTGIWHVVAQLSDMIGMRQVLVSPKKKTQKKGKGVGIPMYIFIILLACYFFIALLFFLRNDDVALRMAFYASCPSDRLFPFALCTFPSGI